MMQRKLLALLFLMPTLAHADLYELTVSRTGTNLYSTQAGPQLLIATKYCYEYVYWEDSLVKVDGAYDSEIIFVSSRERCDIAAIYSETEINPGNYSVNVTRVSEDWYEVEGQGLFLRTEACLALPMWEESIVTLDSGGFGTVFFSDDECNVAAVYSSLRL